MHRHPDYSTKRLEERLDTDTDAGTELILRHHISVVYQAFSSVGAVSYCSAPGIGGKTFHFILRLHSIPNGILAKSSKFPVSADKDQFCTADPL